MTTREILDAAPEPLARRSYTTPELVSFSAGHADGKSIYAPFEVTPTTTYSEAVS